MSRTDDFYEYYMQNLIFPDVHPNATHYALARLEEMGKLRAVVTQNIDGCIRRRAIRKFTNFTGPFPGLLHEMRETTHPRIYAE